MFPKKQFWIWGVCLLLLVGCQINQENPTSTPTPVTVIFYATPEPLPTIKPSAASTVPLPTITPLPTPSASPTPPPFFHKINQLPLSGTKLASSLDDSLLIVTDGENDQYSLFSVPENRVLWQFSYPTGGMSGYAGAISPNNKLVAINQIERDLYILDAETGEVIYQIDDPHEFKMSLSFSPDSQLLAVASSAGYAVTIYSMATGEIVDHFASPSLYETVDGQPVDEMEQIWNFGEAMFLPNQSNVLAITVESPAAEEEDLTWAVYLWDINKQQIKQWLPGRMGGPLAISKNGQLLAVAIDKKVQVWDIQRENFLFELGVNNRPLQALDVSNLGYVTWLDWQYNFMLWSPTGEVIAQTEAGEASDHSIGNAIFTHDNHLWIVYDGLPNEIWRVEIP